MQGTRGQIRTGGDDGAPAAGQSADRAAGGALFRHRHGRRRRHRRSGVRRSATSPAPSRVMAVAWSKDKVGHATTDVTVRDPVVLTATLPRFLLPGDRSSRASRSRQCRGRRPATTRIAVTQRGRCAVGSRRDAEADAARQAARRRRRAARRHRRRQRHRQGRTSPGRRASRWNAAYALDRAAAGADSGAPHGQAAGQGREPDAVERHVRRSRARHRPRFGLGRRSRRRSMPPSLLAALDRYPYRCSEQITSRALPLLYVSDLAKDAQVALDTDDRSAHSRRDRGAADAPGLQRLVRPVERRRRRRLARCLCHRFPDPRARAQDSRCRTRASSSRSIGCATSVANTTDPGKNGGGDLAYALYVLARNGAAPIGDLRYLADAKLDALSTPIAKAQIAAALAMVGDRARAERVYAAALAAIAPQPQPDLIGREDYGSTLARRRGAGRAGQRRRRAARDRAGRGAARRGGARRSLRPTSTQEDAWLLLAASAMAKDAGKVSLDVGGDADNARALPHHPRRRAEGSRLRITNTGEDAGAGGGDGHRRAGHAGARGGKRLQDRARRITRSTAIRSIRRQVKQNTRLVGGAARSPRRSRNSAASSSPIICRPGSRSTIRSSFRPAIPARCRGSPTPVEPVECRIPRRSLHRRVRAQEGRSRRCSPSPMSCARWRPANMCGRRRASRTCIVPTASAAPRPRTVEVTPAK